MLQRNPKRGKLAQDSLLLTLGEAYWQSKSTDYQVAKVKQPITVQAILTFTRTEFTEPLPCASPLSELITGSCEASLEMILSQPRDSPCCPP